MKQPGLEHNADGEDGSGNEEHELVVPGQEDDFNEATALPSASPETTAITDLQAFDDTAEPSQEQALLSPDETWEPFLATSPSLSESLPQELILIILGFLSSSDLYSTSFVNRTAHWLSRIVLIKRYESLLKDSRLWEYLPTIAQDLPEAGGKAFIDYVVRTCGYELHPQRTRPHFRTFSSSLTYLNTRGVIPLSWNGSACNEFAQLQALAQTLLAAYPKELAKPPTTLKAFIQYCSPNTSTSQLLKLWHDYFRLDAQLSTLMLFLRLQVIQSYNRLHRDNPRDEISDLINPHYNRHLRGCGLIALNTVIPGIFERLMREALRLFKIENKNEVEKQRLKQIETLLDRLTEEDLLQYIPPEYGDLRNPPADPTAILAYLDPLRVDPQRALMIEVIDADYLFILNKLSCNILLRIESKNWRTSPTGRKLDFAKSRIISKILRSSYILRNLGENGIIQMLGILFDPENAIKNSPDLWPFLTFELIEKWFDVMKTCLFDYAELLLMIEEVLNNLSNWQILFIAKYLHENESKNVLNSLAFRKRLKKEKAENPHHKNTLLMQLAKLDNTWFANNIAKNAGIASILTHDEIITLMFDPIFRLLRSDLRTQLLQHNDVVFKLSSAELLSVATGNHDDSVRVARNYLNRFNNQHLIQFSTACFKALWCGSEEFNVLLKTLPPELDLRATQLTSAQWLEFACMHHAIGTFVANQHLDKLHNPDLSKLAQHFRKYEDIAQKAKDLLWVREKEKMPQDALASWHERNRVEVERAKRAEHAAAGIIESTIKPPPKEQSDWNWKRIIHLVLFTLLGILGFGLLVLGIGSAIGIPVAVAITTTLFSFLPWSAALTSCIIGFVTHLISGFFIGATPENNLEKPSPSKTTQSSYACFFGSLDCWPDASESKLKTSEVPLPVVRVNSISRVMPAQRPMERSAGTGSTLLNPFSHC